jgi:transcriptional regulator with XRE-family HTH domain
MNTNSIGQAIRHYRHEKRMSQDVLSKLSGVSYNTIVKLEKLDRPANPTIATLTALAKALGVSIQMLLNCEV